MQSLRCSSLVVLVRVLGQIGIGVLAVVATTQAIEVLRQEANQSPSGGLGTPQQPATLWVSAVSESGPAELSRSFEKPFQTGPVLDPETVSGHFAGSNSLASEQELVSASTGEAAPSGDGKLRIICFGAHPDDAELRCGGVAALWAAEGHHVKFVSVTNGDIGHWAMAGGPLAQRRIAEAQHAANILGIQTEVLDIHDGELVPTLENRKLITRLIRQWQADVVIGHRPYDYHPDHRYVGVLIQDSAFMVTVPFICPDTPPLKRNPVFLYSYDSFQRPVPFRADIVIAIDSVIDKKIDALLRMESQFIEGGALGSAETTPKTPQQREAKRQQVKESFRRRFAELANRYRDKLIELYGKDLGQKVQYAEAFEICEYGRQPSKEELRRLFPFLPQQ
ncbi:MAG: PIG-L family deacetylase [Thermoguttaceae bacterium]|nr:PIG-L family deacetylase [Thermoguttaceae bacterium]MDW8039364.1 PIG-L family deacetylase [Thermoguttaceae bacterium]